MNKGSVPVVSKLAFLVFLSLVCVSASSSFAQQPPKTQQPPKILRITREVVRPGKGAELARVQAARSRALASAKWPRVSIALKSLTGPREVWLLTGYDSLAAWGEDDPKAVEKAPDLKTALEQLEPQEEELLSSKDDLEFTFKKDLSYRPDFDWSQMGCMIVTTRHIKKEYEDKYEAWHKAVIKSHQRMKIDEHLLVFELSAGGLENTFIQTIPLKSLYELKALEAAHVGEDTPEMTELMKNTVASEEKQYFCVDPQASYVTDSWAGLNRDFWMTASK